MISYRAAVDDLGSPVGVGVPFERGLSVRAIIVPVVARVVEVAEKAAMWAANGREVN